MSEAEATRDPTKPVRLLHDSDALRPGNRAAIDEAICETFPARDWRRNVQEQG